jgi:hypothetical protein
MFLLTVLISSLLEVVDLIMLISVDKLITNPILSINDRKSITNPMLISVICYCV